jgi:hypothetical protein
VEPRKEEEEEEEDKSSEELEQLCSKTVRLTYMLC